MDKIKWGILSTGKIAHSFAKALQAVPAAELYAVSSRSGEKAKNFAELYGFEKYYGSADEMLADPQVQAVYIASPMSCHYPDAVKCLNAGKHVLCEKTVTLCTSQLDRLLCLAREKNLFFMEAMWTKTMPAFLQAKKWADGGRIGKIKAVKADFVSMCEGDPENRLFRPELGGGALLDLGVYPITLALAFLGDKPDRVHAFANMKNGVDYDCGAVLEYDGAFAFLSFGFDSLSDNRASVIGENGVIQFDPWFHCCERVRLFDKDNRLAEEKYFPHPRTGYEYEITEVCDCLAKGLTESALVPHSSTRAVMEVIDTVKGQIGLAFPDE